MYDLMGKAAGVPVYKLFGQKYRSWVPMASWTVSTHPRRMAQGGPRVFQARVHVAQVPPVPLREHFRSDGRDAGGGAGRLQGPSGFHHGRHERPHAGASGAPVGVPHRRLLRRRAARRRPLRLDRTAQALAPAHRVPSHAIGRGTGSGPARRRCLHARTRQDRHRHPTRRPVLLGQHSIHAPERGRRHHPRHDGAHAGGVSRRRISISSAAPRRARPMWSASVWSR